MTKSEFETKYADLYEIKIGDLGRAGVEAVPCQCNQRCCTGWRMIETKRGMR